MLYDVTLCLHEKDLAFIEKITGNRRKHEIASMADIMIHYFADHPERYEDVVKSWSEKEREL